jgi:uncharacterized protein (TIGR02001 family)
MQKSIAVAAAMLVAQVAFAADVAGPAPASPAPVVQPEAPPATMIALPQPNFDVLAGGFGYSAGVQFMSENIWRGISLTNHRPGALVYGELREGWFYLGGDVLNVTLPTSPAAQLDIYGGVRPAWGPLTLDFGAVYHGRPGNQQQWFLGGVAPVLTFQTPGGLPTTPFDQSFVEIYGKPLWAMNDYLTIGAEFSYAPSWANYNAHALYSGGNAKLSLPGTGFSISGAYGHYFLGMGDPTYGPSYIQPGIKGIQGFKLSSYNTWNIGGSYKWNAVTFDVRYHDTTLTRKGCFTNVANPAGNFSAAVFGEGFSDWCDARVVGSVRVDFDSTMFVR